MSYVFASVKQGVREFKAVLYDLKQLRDCVLLWVSPSISAVVITNQHVMKRQFYSLKVSRDSIVLTMQSDYSTQDYELDLKRGIIKKNGEIHSLEALYLMSDYFQRALADVSEKKAQVFQK